MKYIPCQAIASAVLLACILMQNADALQSRNPTAVNRHYKEFFFTTMAYSPKPRMFFPGGSIVFATDSGSDKKAPRLLVYNVENDTSVSGSSETLLPGPGNVLWFNQLSKTLGGAICVGLSTNGTTLVAFDLVTRKTVWKAPLPKYSAMSGGISNWDPEGRFGCLVYQNSSDIVTCFNAATGKQVFSRTYASSFMIDIAIGAEALVVNAQTDCVEGISVATWQTLWSFKDHVMLSYRVAMNKAGTIALTFTRAANQQKMNLTAFDAKTGKTLGEVSVVNNQDVAIFKAIRDREDEVLVQYTKDSTSDWIALVDISSGLEVKWKTTVPSALYGATMEANTQVVPLVSITQVLLIDCSTGKVQVKTADCQMPPDQGVMPGVVPIAKPSSAANQELFLLTHPNMWLMLNVNTARCEWFLPPFSNEQDNPGLFTPLPYLPATDKFPAGCAVVPRPNAVTCVYTINGSWAKYGIEKFTEANDIVYGMGLSDYTLYAVEAAKQGAVDWSTTISHAGGNTPNMIPFAPQFFAEKKSILAPSSKSLMSVVDSVTGKENVKVNLTGCPPPDAIVAGIASSSDATFLTYGKSCIHQINVPSGAATFDQLSGQNDFLQQPTVISDNLVVAATDAGTLHGFEAGTLKLLWSEHIGSPEGFNQEILAHRGNVVVTRSASLIYIDGTTGKQIWTHSIGDNTQSYSGTRVAVAGDYALVLDCKSIAKLYLPGITAETLSIKWTTPLPNGFYCSQKHHPFVSPGFDTVIISDSFQAFGFTLSTGEATWNHFYDPCGGFGNDIAIKDNLFIVQCGVALLIDIAQNGTRVGFIGFPNQHYHQQTLPMIGKSGTVFMTRTKKLAEDGTLDGIQMGAFLRPPTVGPPAAPAPSGKKSGIGAGVVVLIIVLVLGAVVGAGVAYKRYSSRKDYGTLNESELAYGSTN